MQPHPTSEAVRHAVTDLQCFNWTLQYGDTPLQEALRGGHTATAEVLVKAGADVKAIGKVRWKLLIVIVWSVFSFAVSTAIHYVKKAAGYVVQFTTTDNPVGTDEQELLLHPSSEAVQPPATVWQCCDSILQDQRTPLHEAARGGHTATAELLLKAGADVKAVDWVRWNASVAIISILCYLAVATAFQYRHKSAECLVRFTTIGNAIDTDQ